MRFPAPLRRSAFDLAIQQLRDGRPGESGYGRRIALLLTIPTFDDPIARDVRRAANGELYVIRTVWNRALDLATWRFERQSPAMLGRVPVSGLEFGTVRAPSLHSRQVPVDLTELDSLLEDVGSATICCRSQQAEAPLDAMVFELTFGEELTETRYRWHGESPTGWEPLAQFAARLIRLVEQPAPVGIR